MSDYNKKLLLGEKLEKIYLKTSEAYTREILKDKYKISKEKSLDDLIKAIKFYTNIHFWFKFKPYKATRKYGTSVNDPIYGTFNLPNEVNFLISLPFIQRMNYIKQLSFAYLIYPSATHTRLCHSIGVSELIGKYCDSLKSKGIEISNETKKACQIIGLLHDIGHGPWGHSTEQMDFLKRKGRKEKRDTAILKDYLKDSNSPIVKALEAMEEIDLDLIIKVICDKEKLGEDAFLSDMIDSPTDVDRVDYVNRDIHFTNYGLGKFDYTHFIHSANVGYYKNRKSLYYEETVSRIIDTFQDRRNILYRDVYLKPEKLAADEMLCHALYGLLDEYKILDDKTILPEILKLTDADLMYILRLFGDEYVQELIKNLLLGKVYAPVEEYTLKINGSDFDSALFKRTIDVNNYGFKLKIMIEEELWEKVVKQIPEHLDSNKPQIFTFFPEIPSEEGEMFRKMPDGSKVLVELVDTLIEYKGKIICLKDHPERKGGEKWGTIYKVYLFAPIKLMRYRNKIKEAFNEVIVSK